MLESCTVPPCSSTSDLTIESPSPTPVRSAPEMMGLSGR
jgi:hypothetical protein